MISGNECVFEESQCDRSLHKVLMKDHTLTFPVECEKKEHKSDYKRPQCHANNLSKIKHRAQELRARGGV